MSVQLEDGLRLGDTRLTCKLIVQLLTLYGEKATEEAISMAWIGILWRKSRQPAIKTHFRLFAVQIVSQLSFFPLCIQSFKVPHV